MESAGVEKRRAASITWAGGRTSAEVSLRDLGQFGEFARCGPI